MNLMTTRYTCDKCEHSFVSKSGLKHLECSECGNVAFTRFRKLQLNKRDQLKEKAVNMANDIYDLELTYKKNSRKSDDDIAESILIAMSEVVQKKSWLYE